MDIDVSKENIQPLRGGRNLLQLGQALQAQSDVDAQRQLQQQKEEHEATIRHYQGPDPLDPWFNYIQWIEQSYPKHGHEGHMDRIIKDCLQTFEKDERYYQDRRFVKLWIKYVDCLANPLEIYQRLYNTGIGVECSEFYRAWACYCEESGDFKKANQVYVLGLQARAQPLDELEDAHKNFQLFFAQRILHDDSPTKRKAASALAETRQALTSLKSFKRRNIAAVPVQRIGESIKSTMPGVVRQQVENRMPGSNIMVNVYEDAPSTSQAPIPAQANPGPASLVQACGNIENEKEVGIWTNAKTKMVHTNVVPHQPLAFTPYVDVDDALKLPKNHMPHCVDDLSFTVALCVPDPPDPSKIPRYNKAEVYVNDTEYSLEEIRARKYNLIRKPKTEQETAPEPMNTSNNVNESLVQYSALETLANCALDTEQDHIAQLRPLAIPAIQNIKVTNIHSPGEPKVLVNLDSKEFSELSSKRNDENQRPDKSLNKSNNYDAENLPPTFGKPTDSFNGSLVNNVFGDSITMNTKEARWELRNIFNGDSEPSMVQPVVQQFEVPKFDIHEDRSMTMAINTKNKTEQAEPKGYVEDKENDNKFTMPVAVPPQNINKTAYYEDPTCTQVFNFNIKDASTPNMSQFKKPISHVDTLRPTVPKFNLDESGTESEVKEARQEQQSTVDHHGTGLSVIMEATREYNSKSGSSSSGQSTRNNFTGYTTTPYSEKTQGSNFDSYHQQNENLQPSTSKRTSISQPRLPNGKFARAYPQKPEEKPQMPYLHDHQYQKPVNQAYNGYSPQQRPMPHYQQNYSYQQYPNQMINQGYASPTANAYHSPQHAEIQSPHAPGFHSPPYNQIGYQSPGHAMLSPQHGYPNRQEYHYPNQNENQHVYANQPAAFQSPPHQTQYQSPQYYQRHSQAQSHHQVAPSPHQHHQPSPHQVPPSPHHQIPPSSHQVAPSPHHQVPPSPHNHIQQSHSQISASPHQNYQGYQMHSQYNNASYPNHHPNQSFAQSPYNQPKVESYQHQQFTVHQSTQAQSYRIAQNNVQENQDVQMKQETPVTTEKATPKPSRKKSPSSSLRNIRHEQQNVKNSPDIGFSNQFLNFISNRNEPKDNANTPKFTNSPNISQKMHKNLYVSSPEQAQIPPSSGMSDSDSKDGMTAQTVTPIQSAKISIDKQKDISKRQLDFEHRSELQSEDSRDSGKESRISSVYSRQSDFVSDGYGMDVDSENSMECAAYKSAHSISLVETNEIPRPADIDFPKVIDPFSRKLHSELLEYVKFPNKTHAEGYNEVRSVPKLQVSTTTHVGSNKLSIEKQIGKGNYGAVFLALDLHCNRTVAVKYQKPSRPWEFYMCQEIKARIKDPCMLPGYMDITTAYIADNASLFISEFSRYGSLLDVANKIKVATSKCINEFIVFLLTAEMLSIVHYLHKAQIIHADIKPDNFLLMKIPTEEWRTPSLQLIDLGCAIDMSLFPEGTTFRELIATEGFTCTEMREGRPWTYQTDLYCLAGTIYVILMGNYMKVTNRLGQWNIDKKMPRYMKVSLWDKIFTTLLNVPDCNNLPDLMELKGEVDSLLCTVDTLGSQLRNFANVLNSR